MSRRRIAVPAALAPTKACFGDGDPIVLGGTGYTPSAPVGLAADGRPFSGALTATSAGTIGGRLLSASRLPVRTRKYWFTATDTANPANVGQAVVTRARLRVTISPANANPRRVRRFRARGFTTGRTLYRHITRGKRVSNGRMAKLKGSCRETSVRKRLFRQRTRSGTYRVQFDTKRKYNSKTLQRVRFRVRVYRIVRRAGSASAAAATSGETWTRLP